jgi:mannose-6-phosphate isomerase-like protein (cupin superfamily)
MTMKIEGTIVDGYLKALTGLDRLPLPDGERSIELFRHGTLTIKLYAPRGHDPQTPHLQDEIYVIAHGTGRFRRGAEETSFGPGDVIFVAAGEEHKFTEFTDDFATWVFFYGPEGGEAEVLKELSA